jgi:MFS superfamily sulfate permease-like transporter
LQYAGRRLIFIYIVSNESTEDIMALDDTLIIVVLAVVSAVAIAACIALVFLMRQRGKKPAVQSPKRTEVDALLSSPSSGASPFRVAKSVQSNDAVKAKDELRILDLEREILGDAIRRLYEAHAEGKITEIEREKMAGSYKQRMMSVKEAMSRDESIVALHELEGMQEDLMKLFSERFGELSGKVEELRTRIDVKPVKEIRVQMPRPQAPVVPDQLEGEEEEEAEEEEAEEKEKPKKLKKPQPERQKTEAEQRIDAIRNQIDEVMNKLGQMEMES